MNPGGLIRRVGTELLRLLRPARGSGREIIGIPDESGLFLALDAGVPAAAAAAAAWRDGRSGDARRLLSDHLRERSTPAFFVDLADLPDAVLRARARCPGWSEHARSVPQRLGEYMSYPGVVLPAGVGVPAWSKLPLGPGADLLYPERAHLFSFSSQLARAQAYGVPAQDALGAIVRSWISDTHQRPRGSAYASPLVAVFRSVALSWAWAFVAGCGRRDPQLDIDLLRIVLADGRFVMRRLGTSFPNNHLLADGFILWYLGTLFPEFAEARTWRESGEQVWLTQLERQVHPDGCSFEHTTYYHALAVEMVCAYVLLSDRRGVKIPEWVRDRLREMLRFRLAVDGHAGTGPKIGDTMEVPIFSLDDGDAGSAACYAALLAGIFREPVGPLHAEAGGAERAFWLLGGRWPDSPPQPAPDAARLQSFPQGGFQVLRDTMLDERLVFRTGPPPDVEVCPGHMHADLMSILLVHRDQSIIVDPGTYTYRSRRRRRNLWPPEAPAWREHFQRASAHNAVALDGLDPVTHAVRDFRQGELESRVVTDVLASDQGIAWIECRNVGSTRYSGYRRGILHVHGEYWLIYDEVPSGIESLDRTLTFQLAPEARVRAVGDRAFEIAVGDSRIFAGFSNGVRRVSVAAGQHSPLRGWVSPLYGAVRPAPAICVEPDHRGRVTATLLCPQAPAEMQPCIEVAECPDGSFMLRVSRPTGSDEFRVPAVKSTAGVYGQEQTPRRAIDLTRRSENGPAIERRIGDHGRTGQLTE